jgi:hypothetical protein
VLIILLIAGIGAFALFRLRLKSKLQARIDTIRTAGYPVTNTELSELYKIPGNVENAADTIMSAFSHQCYPNQKESESLPIIGQAELPARTEPLSEQTKILAAQYIAKNVQALELLHAGAEIEHCYYPVDFRYQMSYLAKLRLAVRLLELDAVLHAENDNSQLAVRSVISGFGIARSLTKEHVFISQIVRISCQAVSVSSLEQVINKTKLTDEQLVSLSHAVADAQDFSDMQRWFIGERCARISILMDPASPELELISLKRPPSAVIELYKSLGLADMDAIICLDLMSDCVKSAQLPLHQRQEVAAAIKAKLESKSKIHILLHELISGFSKLITIDLTILPRLRTAQIALAIERYRLAVGKIPNALTDLVPAYLDAVPMDPFDGNELRYKKLETGFVVYSIGEDLSDDNGKEKPPRRIKESPNWDVTFIVER